MHFSPNGHPRALILGGIAAALLSACGGGGSGSPFIDGDKAYRLELTAARTSLPLNMEARKGIPEYWPSPRSPYSTAITVDAFRGKTDDPIPSSDEKNGFNCSVNGSGIENGALYYFDGDENHQIKVKAKDPNTGEEIEYKVPAAYRSILLPVNAGRATFHYVSGSQAGKANIRCSIKDPGTGKNAYNEINITVGAQTGKASQVVIRDATPSYIMPQKYGIQTQQRLQVDIVDEAGQRIPNPPNGAHNLFARIVNTGAVSRTAKLRAQGQSGHNVFATSINGQALFSAISGQVPGLLVVEFITDRSDNNVDNGIADPVSNLVGVQIAESLPTQPIAITTEEELPAAVEDKQYAATLAASGGKPPYQWSVAPNSALPSGLALDSDGLISGVPSVNGEQRFAVKVADSSAPPKTAVKAFSIKIEAAPTPPPSPLVITLSGGRLTTGTSGGAYTEILTASGGTAPYTWAITPDPSTPVSGLVGLPDDLTLNTNGIISGNITSAAGTYNFVVTATDSAGATVSQRATMVVQ